MPLIEHVVILGSAGVDRGTSIRLIERVVSDTPIVMTTDLVLTVHGVSSQEILPLSIKYASALRPVGDDDEKYKRTIEKLQIEKRYHFGVIKPQEIRNINAIR